LLAQLLVLALSRALFNAGSNMDANIAIIAMTTSNSIRVKTCFFIFSYLTPFLFKI
jgi:hypothetical protein